MAPQLVVECRAPVLDTGSIKLKGTADGHGIVPIRAGFTFMLNVLNKDVKSRLIYFISEFCMHVYQRLHLAYTCYCERATDVGFKKGKNTTFTACFSLEMLEKLIMYDAQLLKAVADHHYTNFLALTTFSNEA
jgi:galactokinase/mevalonate kinase-like predicted kinase